VSACNNLAACLLCTVEINAKPKGSSLIGAAIHVTSEMAVMNSVVQYQNVFSMGTDCYSAYYH
jgi:hypothetical protein